MQNKLFGSDHIFSGNAIFVEELYKKYLNDNNSVNEEWQDFFKSIREKESVDPDFKQASWSNRDLKIINSKEFDVSSISEKKSFKRKACHK